MRFNKIYVELTNICGLECDFCPTKTTQTQTMNLNFFKTVLRQIKNYTNTITYHIFGDPLVLNNLKEYLDLTQKYSLKVEIITTGYYLNNFDLKLFLHPAIRQINFSLNSFDKNDMKMSLKEYLNPMIKLSKLKIQKKKDFFINFRLWNLKSKTTINNFNNQVFKILSKEFDIDIQNIDTTKSFRLENKILIDFDNYFIWPSLNSTHDTNGTCYGLKSHFGILSSGIVVPCCLDSFGIINLGNLSNETLEDILNKQKTQNIIQGFKKNIAVEELCKKCSFKDRFNQ